jgi:HlyD family secretion protein
MRRLLFVLPLLLISACSGSSDDAVFQGYVEGDFVDVAPEVGGRIVELAVKRGATVAEGDLLFRVDATEAEGAVDQAEAEKARAEAQLANLLGGKRPPEIAVIVAQIAEAEASLQTARKEFERQQSLFDQKVISEARLDQAREAVSVAEARVESAERQRDVAAMPARTPEIDAGERAIDSAGAALEQAQTRLMKYTVEAPVAGRIEDTHYEMGEVATAGSPVLSLLPENERKVIFFVPQAARAALAPGGTVSVTCDGCPENLVAEISFLGGEAEYTPPVIFSRENRGKLMFRAEAELNGEAANLPIGQPVDVTPALRGSQ